METKSPRISLSIGRATDGPRTVGDINPHGMSFAIYLIWLFMAVLNPSLAAGVPFLDYPPAAADNHSVLLYSFFAASTATLILLGVLDSKIDRLSFVPASIIGAVVLCVVGTLGSILSAFMGVWLVALSGIMMGIGSSFFVISWGAIYVRFRFATTVLNASLSYCIAYIVAIVLMHGVPTQIGAVITLLLPFACIPAMINANNGASSHAQASKKQQKDASPKKAKSEEGEEEIGTYAARCWLSLALLGIVVGALRTICCEEMLWESSLTVGPILCGGAMVSILVMLMVLAMSRKESSWDYLFRAIMPVIIAGIALIAIPVEGGLVSVFFISLSFICAESLIWVFAANVSKDLGISVIKMFGIGFGLAQLGSIVGIWLLNAIVPFSETYNLETTITLAGTASTFAESALNEIGLIDFKYHVALLSLALIVVAAFANAVLPRYYELKRMMSGLLSSLTPTTMLNCAECTKSESCDALGTLQASANTTSLQTQQDNQLETTSATSATSSAASAADHAGSAATQSATTTGAAAATPRETPASKGQPEKPIAYASKASVDSAQPSTSAPERLFNATIDARTSGEQKPNTPSDEARDSADSSSQTPRIESGIHPAPAQAAPGSASSETSSADPNAEKHDPKGSKGSFKRKCDEISETYLLSGREREVIQLLARGHNAAFIMNELCISKSTVKTHINHIYKKLDIHTQQELLNMMEDRDRGPIAQ